jgi:hypothetical protein
MKRKTVNHLILILSGLLLFSGCGSGVKVTGADAQTEYRFGTLEAKLNYPVATVYQASKKAAIQLELPVLFEEQDNVAALIVARDAQDENIKIELEALPGSRTIMTIRVGILGDKNKTNVIFSKIVENLRQESGNQQS